MQQRVSNMSESADPKNSTNKTEDDAQYNNPRSNTGRGKGQGGGKGRRDGSGGGKGRGGGGQGGRRNQNG